MDMRMQLIGFTAIFRYVFRKLLFSRRVVLTVLIAMFVMTIMGYATTQDVDRLDLGTELLDVLVLFFFLPVLAMIYGSSLISDEVEDRSITQIAISPINRAVSFLAYYIGLALTVSVMISAVLTSGFLVFFGRLGFEDTGEIYGAMIAMVVIGSFAYSALFITVSVLIKKPIYFGLFYAFIWEGFIGSIPGRISNIALKHYVRSIGHGWIDHGSISEYSAHAMGTSAVVLVVVTIALLAIGSMAFWRKEFP